MVSKEAWLRLSKDEQDRREERARRIRALIEAMPYIDGKKPNPHLLSLKANLSGDGIRNILRLGDPLISTLTSLAPALDCDLGYLTLEQDVVKKDIANRSKLEALSRSDLITAVEIRKIPVINWAIARDTMVALERYINASTPTIHVDTDKETILATYAPDDSMLGDAKEGDTLVYDYGDTSLVDKKLYLLVHRERLYFRRYRDSAGPARFEATSKDRDYDQIFISDIPKTEIIGRVFQVIKHV